MNYKLTWRKKKVLIYRVNFCRKIPIYRRNPKLNAPFHSLYIANKQIHTSARDEGRSRARYTFAKARRETGGSRCASSGFIRAAPRRKYPVYVRAADVCEEDAARRREAPPDQWNTWLLLIYP